jgi:proton-translocating NADH-quinone oxidoreductase chain M
MAYSYAILLLLISFLIGIFYPYLTVSELILFVSLFPLFRATYKVGLFCLTFCLILSTTFLLNKNFFWLSPLNEFATGYTFFYLNDLNIHFVILTNVVGILVFALSTRAVKTNTKLFYFLLSSIFFFLNALFMSDNLLFFYCFFEALAIPMFILIGLFGGGATRHKAAYKFFIYSLMGSVFLLPALLYIYVTFGTFSIYYLVNMANLTINEQVFLVCSFFIPFAIKMPTIPFHLWLPEAHVEAPTSISVLLAGLLLKTGSFAFYLVICYAFQDGAYQLANFVLVLAVFSLVASSFYALVQTDIKKLIAYSSVSHMNLVLIGLFTFTELGVKGAYLFMLSHGITSAALFSMVGVLYDRGHLRLIRAYNGLVLTMPIFTTLFFIMTLGNSGFPFTPGFFSEFFSFAAFTQVAPIASLISGVSIILALVYSVWCFSRLSFGSTNFLKKVDDVHNSELSVLVAYLFIFTVMGFNTHMICGLISTPMLGLSFVS